MNKLNYIKSNISVISAHLFPLTNNSTGDRNSETDDIYENAEAELNGFQNVGEH